MCVRVVCSAAKVFVLMLSLQMVNSQLRFDQVSAMTSVYQILQNNTSPSFVWNNVLNSSNPCSWKGVGCTPDNSSINTISFESFSILTSEFLPFLCNISTLESLDVSENQLSSIPNAFFTNCGGISGLRILNFSGNSLVGSLPTFNGFASLESLDFSRNSFSGEVSLQLDELGSLKSLDLGKNKFTGKIPTNLGKSNLLENLVLSFNLFSGEIPIEITKYKNLTFIDLSSNRLSGSVPRELGELSMLQTLILSSNSLSGEIPTSISNITTLQRFVANQNMFNGTIPLGITSFLSFLDLSYNSLSGIIPSDLLSGPNLQYLDLSANNLEGPVPSITLTKLLRLRLGSNRLNGTIPSGSLGSNLVLTYLELDNNRLGGEIPPELGSCKNLSLLNLAYNRLGGSLPSSLGNLTNLQVLSLQFNNLVGEIPPQILMLGNLEKLNMSRNLLNGSIPLSISQSIRNLDLQGNYLRGSIPDSVAGLSTLIELQLGSNQLSGRIPEMPVRLQIALNLSHNLYRGPIPNTLSRLQNLEVLDLSNNRFSGEIPSFLTDLNSLTHLLLANNDLTGVRPNFRGSLDVDTEGNHLLVVPDPPSPKSKKSKSIASTVAIAVASGVPVGLLVVIVVSISKRNYKNFHGKYKSFHVNLLSEYSSSINFKKAMKAVSDPSNITLRTRFSTYYKALLPSGEALFVKKVNRLDKMFSLHGHERLGHELQLLASMSHPNLMIPLAYLLTLRGVYFFYDYAPQGTLFDVLHVARGGLLDWEKRYTIAIRASQGLASLHQSRILLLDLSSKSVVLKELDEPRIGDVELWRMINPSESRGSLSTVAGSAGYVPPEYAYTMRVTAAGNVYSYGVLLLELLTGKPAVSEGSELAKWALTFSEKSQWEQILDSSFGSEESIVVRNQMFGVVEVALACVSISPEIRPNMENVVQMLLNTTSN